MATENTTAKEKYVDLFIPKGYANDDPNEFISVNGVNYILPRGKTSKVPAHVKAEYDRAVADRKSTRLNSSHTCRSRMPSSA